MVVALLVPKSWLVVPVVFFAVVRFFADDGMVVGNVKADNMGVYDVGPKIGR